MTAAAKTPETASRLLPILVYIQTHIEERLTLANVAAQAGLSEYHFHRLFHTHIGETLKQYIQRLRLERAAYHLRLHDATVLDIAFSVGFQTHETFSRAFKKRFGLTPKKYRTTPTLPNHPDSDIPSRDILNRYADNYQLSKIHVKPFKEMPLAFIRHIGPYTQVDVTAFDQLLSWAQSEGVYNGRNLLMGIGHDSPTITAPDQLRFDVCLELPHPITPVGEIGYQPFPAATYAMATYIGPFGPTMYQAYNEIFANLSQKPRYEIVGLPAIEIYHTIHINQQYDLHHTDILIPVIAKGLKI